MDNEMSLDKIVEKSKQWTLEGDCTLLQWMNQISNNLEERVTKTSSALNDMSTKLDRTSIALSNATNNLAALQYSKFVENRVHDDDETLAVPVNVPSEDVTDNKNSGQDIYSFLKKNLEMMNSCHEAYSISYEDSDDDDDDEPVTNVVYRSKNPYEARPLPHIYGSTLWKEKWHIGLCDSDNDFSGDENSEQFSESSSTADESYESTAPTMSEWDSTAWDLNTQHNVERKDMRTPSNDGESSYQGEEYPQSKVSTPRAQRSSVPISQQPPIQDQRYYHHIPRRQESLFDDIFNESKPQEVAAQVVSPQVVPPSPQVMPAPQKKIIPESYIPNEPPPDEQSLESDSNRRVGAKKTLNLFDDDEFSSFMDQIVQKATNKNIKSNEEPQRNPEPPKTSVAPNIFNNSNDYTPPDDDFQRQPKKAETSNIFDESNVRTQKQPIRYVPPQNLFSDSDDLFDRSHEKQKEPTKKVIAPNLFNDSDDLFPPSISQPPIEKRKSSSPKLEDDIFTASPKSAAIIGKTKIKNLFDDDDEDDDFDNIFASKPSTSKTFTQATKNLIADDLSVEHENEGLTLTRDESIKEVAVTSKGLFDDDQYNPVLREEVVPKASLSKETSNVQKSIFDDEEARTANFEKETSPNTPVLKEDNTKIGSLLKKGLFDDFDDLEDENDIFTNKPAKRNSFENLFEKEKPDKKRSTIQNKTLFGDDSEEESPKAIESKKEDQNDKLKTSIDSMTKESPDDIFVQRSGQNKTQIEDIFADDVPADNFADFVSSKLAEKLNEESGDNSESSKNPIALKLPDIAAKVTEPTMKPSSIEPKILFGDDNEEENLNIIQSKKEDQVEGDDNNKQSSDSMTPEAIFAPNPSKKKTQLDDMFADDDAADNFDDFVSSKPKKVFEESADIAESPTKLPFTAPKPTEATLKPPVTPKLPVIAQKPLVDKTSKPQVMPKKNIKTILSERTQEENDLHSKASQHEKEKISLSQSESLSAPQLFETTNKQTAGVSKLDSTSEVTKTSELSTSAETEVQDRPSLMEKENSQTQIVVKSDGEDLKPIPKPKVIIEDVKISSPSKDIKYEKSPVEQSEKKPSTIPSYTSLFHDDLPPEDENPNPASNEESPLHQVDDDIEVKPISSTSTSAPYSSLNLFADVPPDDYFSVSTPSPVVGAAVEPHTKRIHSIFYDDFHETIEAGREMRAPSNYMINDEPPPDDSSNKPVISEIKIENPKVPEIQKNKPQFSEIHNEKPQISEIQKEKPQVSKLKKMNIQINVGALLPSAKIPSFKKPETIAKHTPSEILTNENLTSSVKSPIDGNIVPSQPERTKELPENILPNLNRDRAKVQVKRRPSTRTGRQERYRKSMIEDTVSSAYHEESDRENEIKHAMSSSVFEGFASRTHDIQVSNQEVLKEKNEIKEQKPVASSLFEDFGTIDKQEKLNEESKEVVNQMPSHATLFEESDNIFNKKVTSSSSSSSKATINKIPTLFKEFDSKPENIFETIKSIKSNTKKSEIDTVPPVTKNLDSLFDSDDGIDENPFGTPKNFFPTLEINKPTEEMSKPPNLLSESSVHQKEPTSQLVQPVVKPTEKPAEITKKLATLFGDSDDGSDDLFKEARTSKKAVAQKKPEQNSKTKPITRQAKPSASLFSSDEDSGSGDDIFGKAKTKKTSKKIEPVKDKGSSNLFADLSDDDSDGLFGTSAKKTIGANKSKTNPPTNRAQSTKQPAQAQPAKAINSNPLSDLLGP